jgi:hypothetical protein
MYFYFGALMYFRSGVDNSIKHEGRRAVDHVFGTFGSSRIETAAPHCDVYKRGRSLCHVFSLSLRWAFLALRNLLSLA